MACPGDGRGRSGEVGSLFRELRLLFWGQPTGLRQCRVNRLSSTRHCALERGDERRVGGRTLSSIDSRDTGGATICQEVIRHRTDGRKERRSIREVCARPCSLQLSG